MRYAAQIAKRVANVRDDIDVTICDMVFKAKQLKTSLSPDWKTFLRFKSRTVLTII